MIMTSEPERLRTNNEVLVKSGIPKGGGRGWICKDNTMAAWQEIHERAGAIQQNRRRSIYRRQRAGISRSGEGFGES